MKMTGIGGEKRSHLFSFQYIPKGYDFHPNSRAWLKDIFRSRIGKARMVEESTGLWENTMADSVQMRMDGKIIVTEARVELLY